MKHSPATPLPWRVGDAGRTVFGPPNGNPSPEIVAHSKRHTAAYIAHAANAYPRLVEALRKIIGGFDRSESGHSPLAGLISDDARALLRELGEDQ